MQGGLFMFLKKKKNILDLLDTVVEMVHAVERLRNQKDAVADCLAAMAAVHNQLAAEEAKPTKSLKITEEINNCFQELHEQLHKETKSINKYMIKLLRNLLLLKQTIQMEIIPKLNVAFFPYKASMWNSLATVYEAAAQDENCVAKVIPVPFYELSETTATPMYEGQLFPKDTPITHYSQYDLETEQPDIIFVHNIYDQYNTITRLHETYFVSNLKKYTDMLVYVPYCVSDYKVYGKGELSSEFISPAMEFVDKIIVANTLIKEGLVINGVDDERILVLGSPKIDSIVRALKVKESAYPKGWQGKLEGKTVYLLNTGCLFFANNQAVSFTNFLSWLTTTILVTSKANALIWRPHPLTLVCLKKYTPQCVDWYENTVRNIKTGIKGRNKSYIFDDSPDYIPAFNAADVLVSFGSSLDYEYMVTEKKILYYSPKLPEKSLLDCNAFYFESDQEGISELSYKFCNGYDPCAPFRKGLAKKIFANVEGTCGDKVYNVIKDLVLAV